jgi:hypothetical protein
MIQRLLARVGCPAGLEGFVYTLSPPAFRDFGLTAESCEVRCGDT